MIPSLTFMMIPKELIEKERKAEQRVNTAIARYVKAQREYGEAVENLTKTHEQMIQLLNKPQQVPVPPEIAHVSTAGPATPDTDKEVQ